MSPFLPPLLLLLQAVISVHTDVVAVPVTVTDARGQLVSGLRPEHFRVFDEGRERPIAVFHQGDAPITLGLIVDRSQSMRPKARVLMDVLSGVLQSSRPDDELFAVAFNDNVSLALGDGRPFTSDPAELATAMAGTRAEGRTALYDGLAEGFRHLVTGHTGRLALIVVSDGGDNASRHTYAQVLEMARRSGAVIYAIGLLGTSSAEEEEDPALLDRLSADTGGTAHFPRTAAEIAVVAAAIGRELREQYTIGFEPAPHGRGPVFRKITVRVTVPGRRGLHVRARAVYPVPGRPQDRHTP